MKSACQAISCFFVAVLCCCSCASVDEVPNSRSEEAVVSFVEDFYFRVYDRRRNLGEKLAILRPYLGKNLFQKLSRMRDLELSVGEHSTILPRYIYNVDFFYGYSEIPDKFHVRKVNLVKDQFVVCVDVGWSEKARKNIPITSAKMEVVVEREMDRWVITDVVFLPYEKHRYYLSRRLSRGIRGMEREIRD